MGRPRRWATDAERKAAARAGNGDAPLEEPEPRLPELLAGRPAPPLEVYVAAARAAVEDLLARGLVDASRDGKPDDEGARRIARAEAYARWRHGEFLAGRVNSL